VHKTNMLAALFPA